MGTGKNLKYHLSIHPSLLSDDLLAENLPPKLREDFELYKKIFKIGPSNFYKFEGLGTHELGGKLEGYSALDIEWEGNKDAYKLVYRVDFTHKPKIIYLISFSSHNESYDLADERVRATRRRGSKKISRKSATKRRPSRPN